MEKAEEIRKGIEELGKELGILIEVAAGLLPYDEMILRSIKTMLFELYIPNEHKVAVLKMVIKEYE